MIGPWCSRFLNRLILELGIQERDNYSNFTELAHNFWAKLYRTLLFRLLECLSRKRYVDSYRKQKLDDLGSGFDLWLSEICVSQLFFRTEYLTSLSLFLSHDTNHIFFFFLSPLKHIYYMRSVFLPIPGTCTVGKKSEIIHANFCNESR